MSATKPKPEIITLFQYLAAIIGAAIAATVLTGWSIGSASLTRILAGSIAMNPMTAVSILVISLALMLRGPAHSSKVRLLGSGVKLVVDNATRIDAAARRVELASGRALDYDYVIYAVGSTGATMAAACWRNDVRWRSTAWEVGPAGPGGRWPPTIRSRPPCPSPTAGGHALAILVGRGWMGSTWQRSSTGPRSGPGRSAAAVGRQVGGQRGQPTR